MTSVGFPTCPACGRTDGWIIDSPVGAIDRVRLDGSGLTEVGLFAPDDGFDPLGRPLISCAGCETVAEGEELRAAVLVAAAPRPPLN